LREYGEETAKYLNESCDGKDVCLCEKPYYALRRGDDHDSLFILYFFNDSTEERYYGVEECYCTVNFPSKLREKVKGVLNIND